MCHGSLRVQTNASLMTHLLALSVPQGHGEVCGKGRQRYPGAVRQPDSSC